MLKNKFSAFLFAFAFFATSLNADIQRIQTQFEAPFDVVFVSDEWTRNDKLWDDEDEDEDDFDDEDEVVGFQLATDGEVGFQITAGPALAPFSLDDLQNQLQSFADGVTDRIPLFEDGAIDEEDAEAMKEFYSLIQVNPNITRVEIGGKDWLKFQMNITAKDEESVYENDILVSHNEEYRLISCLFYVTVMGEHSAAVLFGTTPEKFDTQVQRFDQTMLTLFNGQ